MGKKRSSRSGNAPTRDEAEPDPFWIGFDLSVSGRYGWPVLKEKLCDRLETFVVELLLWNSYCSGTERHKPIGQRTEVKAKECATGFVAQFTRATSLFNMMPLVELSEVALADIKNHNVEDNERAKDFLLSVLDGLDTEPEDLYEKKVRLPSRELAGIIWLHHHGLTGSYAFTGSLGAVLDKERGQWMIIEKNNAEERLKALATEEENAKLKADLKVLKSANKRLTRNNEELENLTRTHKLHSGETHAPSEADVDLREQVLRSGAKIGKLKEQVDELQESLSALRSVFVKVGRSVEKLYLPIVSSQIAKLLAVVAIQNEKAKPVLPSESRVLEELGRLHERGSTMHRFASTTLAKEGGYGDSTVAWLLKTAEKRNACAHPDLFALEDAAALVTDLHKHHEGIPDLRHVVTVLQGQRGLLNDVMNAWTQAHWQKNLEAESAGDLGPFVVRARQGEASQG